MQSVIYFLGHPVDEALVLMTVVKIVSPSYAFDTH